MWNDCRIIIINCENNTKRFYWFIAIRCYKIKFIMTSFIAGYMKTNEYIVVTMKIFCLNKMEYIEKCNRNELWKFQFWDLPTCWLNNEYERRNICTSFNLFTANISKIITCELLYILIPQVDQSDFRNRGELRWIAVPSNCTFQTDGTFWNLNECYVKEIITTFP